MNQSENKSEQANEVSDVTATAQFVGFQLESQNYAFEIEKIQEIVNAGQVTRVPQVAEYVDGVMNLRGTIIPVINLRLLLNLEHQSFNEDSRIIVVNVGERTIGCIVDSVSQVIRLPVDSIQPAPALVSPDNCPYVLGFSKTDESLLVLLDIENLLDPEKLESVHEAAKEQLETLKQL